jgi:hypothetical protein
MNNKWVKPFSSGLSCIDTVDGECLTNLNEEECENYCKSHPFCDNGYYIRYSNKQYCVPLNGLQNFGMRDHFEQSTFDKEKSRFFHPSIGVHMKVFNRVKDDIKDENTFLPYITNPFMNSTFIQHSPSNRYLTSQLETTSNIENASKWRIFRYLFDFSGLNSSAYDRISNGEIVTIQNFDTDDALLFHDSKLKLLPASITMGASSSFFYNNVYYFQIFQSKDDDKKLDITKPFAIRINTLPCSESCYYLRWDDTNSKLYAHESKTIENEMMKYMEWRFLPTNIETNTQDIQKFFIESQYNYAQNYLGADLNQKNYQWVLYLFLIIIIIVVGWKFFSKRRQIPILKPKK